jgi:hypothetical protein
MGVVDENVLDKFRVVHQVEIADAERQPYDIAVLVCEFSKETKRIALHAHEHAGDPSHLGSWNQMRTRISGCHTHLGAVLL